MTIQFVITEQVSNLLLLWSQTGNSTSHPNALFHRPV